MHKKCECCETRPAKTCPRVCPSREPAASRRRRLHRPSPKNPRLKHVVVFAGFRRSFKNVALSTTDPFARRKLVVGEPRLEEFGIAAFFCLAHANGQDRRASCYRIELSRSSHVLLESFALHRLLGPDLPTTFPDAAAADVVAHMKRELCARIIGAFPVAPVFGIADLQVQLSEPPIGLPSVVFHFPQLHRLSRAY